MINFAKLYDFFINNNAKIQRIFLKGKVAFPIHISVELNFFCNLRCQMCYHINELSRSEFLSFEDMKRILSKLPRNVLLSYTGGETLLNKDYLKIFEYTKNLYNFTITTNGILLIPETVDFLLDISSKHLFNKGLMEIGISFQGPPQAYEKIIGNKDFYYKIIDNLKYLIQQKKKRKLRFPLIDLRLTVQKDNIDYLFDVYKLGKDLEVNHCNFAIMDTWRIYDRKIKDYNILKLKFPENIEDVDAEELRKILTKIKEDEKNNHSATKVRFTPSCISIDEFVNYYKNKLDFKGYDCFALWSNILISPLGDVVLCRDLVLGNIIKEDRSLMNIINSTPAIDLRSDILKNGLFPMCVGCCALESKS